MVKVQITLVAGPATKLARKFKNLRAIKFCAPQQTRAVESLWNHAGGKHGETERERGPAPTFVRSGSECDRKVMLDCVNGREISQSAIGSV